MLGLVAKVFGSRTAALMAIFILLDFGTFQRLTGNFFQFAWLAALVAGISLFKARRFTLSAFGFALATMLRVFPVLFLSGLIVKFVSQFVDRLILKKRPDKTGIKGYSHFFGWFALFCGLFFGIGSMSPRGLDAWTEFYQNISLHGSYVVGELFTIGLKNLVVTIGAPSTGQLMDYSSYFADNQHRLMLFEQRRVIYYLLAGLLGALFIMIARKIKDEETFSLSIVVLYLALALSPYYYLSLVVIPLLPTGNRLNLLTKLGLFGLLFYHAANGFMEYIDFWYYLHFKSEALIFFFMLLLIIGYTVFYAKNDFQPSKNSGS